MIVHAACASKRIWVTNQCLYFITVSKGVCDLPWFDILCKEKRRLFRVAVQGGQAVHACKFAKNEYRHVQTRRAERAQKQSTRK
jgi:hypothetical protein